MSREKSGAVETYSSERVAIGRILSVFLFLDEQRNNMLMEKEATFVVVCHSLLAFSNAVECRWTVRPYASQDSDVRRDCISRIFLLAFLVALC